ncbi:MAG: ADP-ribosylglycohydrolase family protein [Solirubrobacteraceae bacterium]
MINEAVLDRARGCLLGLAAGDALGGPVEWLSPEEIERRHGGPLRELTGGGWLGLRPGQVTDDTDMALALARSLDEAGGYDAEVAMGHYLAWFNGNPPDVGNTIGAVLRAVGRAVPAAEAARRVHESSGGKSAGNGSLMRCAPLAVRYQGDLLALPDVAGADSQLTHHDPLAAEACVLFTTVLAARIAGHTLLEAPARDPRLIEALNSDPAEAARRARKEVGFVLTALAVARCADRRAGDFEDGLVWAVNLGGDADTNGAVTGALLGARFGASAIPGRWLEALEPRRELVGLADLLATADSA